MMTVRLRRLPIVKSLVMLSQVIIKILITISQYCGWAKYCYHKVPKNRFAHAKELTVQWLNACPDEVIQCFINQIFHFMSAIPERLKGKAALWAVQEQKSH